MGKLVYFKSYEEKKAIVRDKMIGYFEDLYAGEVNIPAFQAVDQLMRNKTKKQIIGHYRRLINGN